MFGSALFLFLVEGGGARCQWSFVDMFGWERVKRWGAYFWRGLLWAYFGGGVFERWDQFVETDGMVTYDITRYKMEHEKGRWGQLDEVTDHLWPGTR